MLLKAPNHNQLILLSGTVKERGNVTVDVAGFQTILSNRMLNAKMQEQKNRAAPMEGRGLERITTL